MNGMHEIQVTVAKELNMSTVRWRPNITKQVRTELKQIKNHYMPSLIEIKRNVTISIYFLYTIMLEFFNKRDVNFRYSRDFTLERFSLWLLSVIDRDLFIFFLSYQFRDYLITVNNILLWLIKDKSSQVQL